VAITMMPGEDELEALRDGALRVLAGHEVAQRYRPLGISSSGRDA